MSCSAELSMKKEVLSMKKEVLYFWGQTLNQSLLCVQWVIKDPSFLHADSEDSEQTDLMYRLI